MKCPYCFETPVKVNGDIIYPNRNDLHHKEFLYCQNGHDPAYVGIQNGKPLGSLANQHLRKLRSLAHKSFDNLWKNKKMSRDEAYRLLSKEMNLPKEKTHIGMFNEKQCRKVLEIIVDINSF